MWIFVIPGIGLWGLCNCYRSTGCLGGWGVGSSIIAIWRRTVWDGVHTGRGMVCSVGGRCGSWGGYDHPRSRKIFPISGPTGRQITVNVICGLHRALKGEIFKHRQYIAAESYMPIGMIQKSVLRWMHLLVTCTNVVQCLEDVVVNWRCSLQPSYLTRLPDWCLLLP